MAEKRVRVTFDITVDESIGEGPELRQNVYDAVVNYLHVQHLMDQMKWMTEKPPEASNLDIERWKIGAQNLQAYHKNWAEIIKNADYDIVEI